MFICDLFDHADYSPTQNITETKGKISASEDPCWKGYHMVGTKNKKGREVPNCVPGEKGAMNENAYMSDVIRAHELIASAVSDPAQKQAYFDFLTHVRKKYGTDYSTEVHQQAAKLAKG